MKQLEVERLDVPARREKGLFHHRSDRPRSFYLHLREAMDVRRSIPRRLAARESARRATLKIPRSLGLAVFPPSRFPEVDEIVAAAQGAAARADLKKRSRAKKPTFMIPTLEDRELTLDSPFLRFALRDDILAGVSAYLGVVPILTKVNVYYSQSGGQELKSSQLFHCDGEAISQMKIFVLCSDVTPANGPLTVIGAENSKVARRKVQYKYGLKVTDEQIAGAVGKMEQHTMIGPPGTVCFVDTSRCFHYGSRVEGDAGPRTVALIQFLTHFSYPLLRNYEEMLRFRHLATPDMPKLTRLVLGAD